MLNNATPLDPSRRGFKTGASTLDNLRDICSFITKAKILANHDRTQKKPLRNRQPKAIIFIDLARAFDTVIRTLLIQKLRSRNFSDSLINLIANMLSTTSHVFESEDQ
jgi:hypothetical protein